MPSAVEMSDRQKLVPDEIAANYKVDQPAPTAKIEDLTNCDAIIMVPAQRLQVGTNHVDYCLFSRRNRHRPGWRSPS